MESKIVSDIKYKLSEAAVVGADICRPTQRIEDFFERLNAFLHSHPALPHLARQSEQHI